MLPFLLTRVRRWLVLAVLLPVAGRGLEALGVRLGDRHPRAGSALQRVGGTARRRGRGRRRR